MMQTKMTLQEYIESRNYKRRLSSKSKSKGKRMQPSKSPIRQTVTPPVQKQPTDLQDPSKIPTNSQISGMIKQIKSIDESVQGFSRIHKKVQQIKEFARQYIHDDKKFVSFCKSLFDLEAIYRLQLIEAYRYQLFKFQFENQKCMTQDKKRILKELNDHYMNSKFEYKKVILKEKVDLTKTHKQIIQTVIATQSKVGQQNNQYNSQLNSQLINSPSTETPNFQPSVLSVESLTSSQYINSQLKTQPILQKRPSSFLQAFLPVKNTNAQSEINQESQINAQSVVWKTEYTTKASQNDKLQSQNKSPKVSFKESILGKPKSPEKNAIPLAIIPEITKSPQKNKVIERILQKPTVKIPDRIPARIITPVSRQFKSSRQKQPLIKQKSPVTQKFIRDSKIPQKPKIQSHFQRAPSSKKVVFVPHQSIRQTQRQYKIPDFEVKVAVKKESLTSNPEQPIKDHDQSNVQIGQSNFPSSGSSQNDNLLSLIQKKSSKDEVKNQKNVKAQTLKKTTSNEDLFKKKSPRQVQSQKERQKLLQSKDYLRVKRS